MPATNISELTEHARDHKSKIIFSKEENLYFNKAKLFIYDYRVTKFQSQNMNPEILISKFKI